MILLIFSPILSARKIFTKSRKVKDKWPYAWEPEFRSIFCLSLRVVVSRDWMSLETN